MLTILTIIRNLTFQLNENPNRLPDLIANDYSKPKSYFLLNKIKLKGFEILSFQLTPNKNDKNVN